MRGRVYELERGFLAGHVVDVVYSYLDDPPRPEVEYEGKRYLPLPTVAPVANSRRRRPEQLPGRGVLSQPVSFNPGCMTRSDAAGLADHEEDLDAIF